MSTYKLVCPHCAAPIRIRTSEGLSPLFRVAYLQCTNEPCGFTARAELEITHQLSPSGLPNPSIQLPQASKFMQQNALNHAHKNPNQQELSYD